MYRFVVLMPTVSLVTKKVYHLEKKTVKKSVSTINVMFYKIVKLLVAFFGYFIFNFNTG